MAAHFERDIKLKETEKHSLEIRITKLQDELKRSNGDLAETVIKLRELNRKYKEMKTQYKSNKGYFLNSR